MTTVAMLSNLFAPVVSGSSTQCGELSRELVRQGHRVIVITARLRDDSPDVENVDGVTVYRLPAVRLPRHGIALNFEWLNMTIRPGNRAKMLDILKRERADVLHIHNHMFDMALNGAWLSKRLNLPAAVTIHTIIKHSNPVYDAVLSVVDRYFLKPAVIDNMTRVICPDVNVKEYVDRRFRHGDSIIIPYGVAQPPKASPELMAALRAEFGLTGKRVILSLGHVHAIRNRHDLIRAMPLVRRAVPDAALVVVGSINVRSPVELAEGLGLGDAVVFTGAQSRERVGGFLAMAELEAHWLNQDDPSRTSLGVASMEAMGAGCPVLAAANLDTFGPGVLVDGETLRIVRPDDPEGLAQRMIELLEDGDARLRMGEAARRCVESRFSWSGVAARTATLYEEITAAGRR